MYFYLLTVSLATRLTVTVGLSASVLSRSRNAQEACKRMVDELQDPPKSSPDCLFMTMSAPSDALPLDVMLAHQIKNIGGPEARVEVMIDYSKNWPESLLGGHVMAELGNLGVGVSCHNFTHRGIDANDTLLQLLNPAPAKLSDLYANDPRGRKLLSNAVGMLTFLERCMNSPTNYCAWLDPDIFLHRPVHSDGWLGQAIKLMRSRDTVAVMAPTPPRITKYGDCHTADEESVAQISQRYFALNRKRLQKALPLFPHDCSPNCRGFEFDLFFFPDDATRAELAKLKTGGSLLALNGKGDAQMLNGKDETQSFLLPSHRRLFRGDKMFHMGCATQADPWALHPQTTLRPLLRMLQSCTSEKLPEAADASQGALSGIELWPHLRKPLQRLLTVMEQKGAFGPLSQDGQNMDDDGWSCEQISS